MNKPFWITAGVGCVIISVATIAIILKVNTDTNLKDDTYIHEAVLEDGFMITEGDYASCTVSSEHFLLGTEDNKQCATDGFVYFENGQRPEELFLCTSYYDGCNTALVEQGEIKGVTRKYCAQAEGPAACFIDDAKVEVRVGTIIAATESNIEVLFGETVEVLQHEGLLTVGVFNVGDTLEIIYYRDSELDTNVVIGLTEVYP